ncbi:ABC transporter substrate-binding protein [Geomesophilobacter sediminis]|uniref:ABC transporter substrate-binding protein n=1 Tax=Geomesophilobacter sediminis TaxID=2798584 RepID=A0A8J7JDX4_9BACT|nr:ABC transporter substrate binding protein [Geomesophilobacter sediminis]MBJ6723984.1 ABC transporter substrate-binding protein [Geomesophilobacter sediminis]
MQILSALISLIIAAVLLTVSPANAADILVVQSVRDASFTEVMKGFRSSCSASVRTLILSDYTEVDVPRVVREEQPSLILSLGESAYNAVKKVRRTPIVSLMSLGLSLGRSVPNNVTGVGIVAPPDQYMKVFASMGARRVGVLYNPARSGNYLNQARRAAERAGLDILAIEVREPRDVVRRLEVLKGRVDALWLLPDTTAVSPATTEAFFLFSMEQWKPVVAFSGNYLRMGAAASVDVERFEMGRQGGEIASRILNGSSPSDIPFQDPVVITVKKNATIQQKLGIKSDSRR